MSENGKSHKSLPSELIGLLEDQLDLASLEWQYEKKQGVRRLGTVVVAIFLAFAAFMFSQVALVAGIVAMGISVWLASLVLAGVYGMIAVLLLWKFGRRDPKTGTPFQASRTELKKNLKWIQQIFS